MIIMHLSLGCKRGEGGGGSKTLRNTVSIRAALALLMIWDDRLVPKTMVCISAHNTMSQEPHNFHISTLCINPISRVIAVVIEKT